MRFGGEPGLVQDNGASFEVGDRERAHQHVQFCGGKPGKSLQAAQVVEVGGTLAFEFIQFCTIRVMSEYTLLAGRRETDVTYSTKAIFRKEPEECAREANRSAARMSLQD